MLAWTNASAFQSAYWREEDPPSVTFDGSQIHTEKFIPVSDGWYQIYDEVVKGSSPAFIGVAAIVISFAITFIVFLIISIFIHIYQGKPIRDFFQVKGAGESK